MSSRRLRKQEMFAGLQEYIKIQGNQPPSPWPQQVTANLNLTCKNIFKKKQMKYFQLLQEKSNFVSLRKQLHVPSFLYQAYSGVIQAYSVPCVTLTYSELWYIQNPGIFETRGIFRTLVYPKLWHIQNLKHIQNPGQFRALRFSEPEAYSEPCQTSRMEHFEKQLTAIIIFAISAFHVLYFMK